MTVKWIGTGSGLNVTPDYSDIVGWDSYLNGLGTFTQDQIGRVLWASSANELVVTANQVLDGSVPSSYNIILEAGDADGNAGGSFKDNANKLTNALRYNASNGAAIRQSSGDTDSNAGTVTVSDTNTIIRNLQITKSGTGLGHIIAMTVGESKLSLQNCIVDLDTNAACFQIRIINGTAGIIMENCLVTRRTAPASGNGVAVYCTDNYPITATNCTFVATAATANRRAIWCNPGGNTVNLKNCAFYGWNTSDVTFSGGTLNISYCATDWPSGTSGLNSGSNNQYDLVGSTEFENVTHSTEDCRLKSTSAKCLDHGTATGAPSTDIVGQSRSGTTDIGVWEYQTSVTYTAPTPSGGGTAGGSGTVVAVSLIRPASDASVGAWKTNADATTDLYATLDEVTASDADFIKSPLAPSAAIYRLYLQVPASAPVVTTGHIIRIRYDKEGSGTINLVVRLKQGVTTVVTYTYNDIPDAITQRDETLTTEQAATINWAAAVEVEFEVSMA